MFARRCHIFRYGCESRGFGVSSQTQCGTCGDAEAEGMREWS